MSFILLASITLSLFAFGGALFLVWRLRDWRIAFLPAMAALIVVQAAIDLSKEPLSWTIRFPGPGDDLPVLLVSIMVWLAIFFLERLIRERRKVEKELAEKSAVLEVTLENMGPGISMFDADLNLIVCNRKYLEILDLPPGYFNPGDTIEKLFRYLAERGEYGPGDVEEQVREHIELAKRFVPRAIERTRPDGTVLKILGHPVPGGGFVSTHTDITELKRAEEQARSARKRLALAIDGLAEHVVLFDSDDRIVLANAAWRELNKDIIETTVPGTRFEDHLRGGIKAGLLPEAVGREEEWLRWRMEHHRNPTGPFEVERQDGRWVMISEQRLPDGGTILIISDITDRKRLEEGLAAETEKMRMVLEHMPGGIFMIDEDLKLQLFNDKFHQWLGIPKKLAKEGASIIPILEYRAKRGDYGEGDPKKQLKKRIADFHDRKALRADYSGSGGRILETIRTPMTGGGIVSVFTDITERSDRATLVGLVTVNISFALFRKIAASVVIA